MLYCNGDPEVLIDPYVMNESKLKDGIVALWPAVKRGKIYMYFTDMPGQLTREEMKFQKSFDAFSYYIWCRLLL